VAGEGSMFARLVMGSAFMVVWVSCMELSKGNLDKWHKGSAIQAHQKDTHANIVNSLLGDPALRGAAKGSCPAAADCACFDLQTAAAAKFLHFGDKTSTQKVCPACCSKKGLAKSTAKVPVKLIQYCNDADRHSHRFFMSSVFPEATTQLTMMKPEGSSLISDKRLW
jgi:hypothetical protein